MFLIRNTIPSDVLGFLADIDDVPLAVGRRTIRNSKGLGAHCDPEAAGQHRKVAESPNPARDSRLLAIKRLDPQRLALSTSE
jgi:hypothetical protein